MLSEAHARETIDRQIEVIESQWDEVCDAAGMSEVERTYFWRRH